MAIKVASCRLGVACGAISAAFFAVLLLFEGIDVDRAASPYVNAWIASFVAAMIAIPLGFVGLIWPETRVRAGLTLLLTVPMVLVVGYMAYVASQLVFGNSF
jgi:hypothetical protein